MISTFYSSCMSCVFAASNYFATKNGATNIRYCSSGGQFTRIRSGSDTYLVCVRVSRSNVVFCDFESVYSVIHRVKFHQFLSEVGFQ